MLELLCSLKKHRPLLFLPFFYPSKLSPQLYRFNEKEGDEKK